MLVLALDTATTDLVAGIVDGDRVLAETAVATRAHNETLMPEITRLLDTRNGTTRWSAWLAGRHDRVASS